MKIGQRKAAVRVMEKFSLEWLGVDAGLIGTASMPETGNIVKVDWAWPADQQEY